MAATAAQGNSPVYASSSRSTVREKGESFITPALNKKTNQTDSLQNAPLRSRSQNEQFATKRIPTVTPVLAYSAAALVKNFSSNRGTQVDTHA